MAPGPLLRRWTEVSNATTQLTTALGSTATGRLLVLKSPVRRLLIFVVAMKRGDWAPRPPQATDDIAGLQVRFGKTNFRLQRAGLRKDGNLAVVMVNADPLGRQ